MKSKRNLLSWQVQQDMEGDCVLRRGVIVLGRGEASPRGMSMTDAAVCKERETGKRRSDCELSGARQHWKYATPHERRIIEGGMLFGRGLKMDRGKRRSKD